MKLRKNVVTAALAGLLALGGVACGDGGGADTGTTEPAGGVTAPAGGATDLETPAPADTEMEAPTGMETPTETPAS